MNTGLAESKGLLVVTKQCALVGCLMTSLFAQAIVGAPARAPIDDADTRGWWKITADLSGDDMEGRDAGSPGHARAAAYVAARFKAAGLKPAGDAGAYTQTLLRRRALQAWWRSMTRDSR